MRQRPWTPSVIAKAIYTGGTTRRSWGGNGKVDAGRARRKRSSQRLTTTGKVDRPRCACLDHSPLPRLRVGGAEGLDTKLSSALATAFLGLNEADPQQKQIPTLAAKRNTLTADDAQLRRAQAGASQAACCGDLRLRTVAHVYSGRAGAVRALRTDAAGVARRARRAAGLRARASRRSRLLNATSGRRAARCFSRDATSPRSARRVARGAAHGTIFQPSLLGALADGAADALCGRLGS